MERVNNNKNRKNGLIENGQLFVKIVIFGVTLPFYEGQNLKKLGIAIDLVRCKNPSTWIKKLPYSGDYGNNVVVL